MSRIGNKVITVPEGVEISVDGNLVTVKGKNGELSREISPIIDINIEDNEITFTRPDDSKSSRTIHGTTRAIVNNMVEGVTDGFEKVLELNGVGYRAQKQGTKVVVNVGLSHPVEFVPVEGLTVDVPSNTVISIKGANKEHVGALAASIRAVRPPEPYKGKGIRYRGEFVRRKEGKTGK